jgi:hypothetical protein
MASAIFEPERTPKATREKPDATRRRAMADPTLPGPTMAIAGSGGEVVMRAA